MPRTQLFRVLLPVVVFLSCLSIADSIVYVRVHRDLIEQHLKLEPQAEADRVKTLRQLFNKAGCPQVSEQEVPKQDFPNLICIIPGEEEGTIIVGTASDYTTDQWSTLTMLPLLAESIIGVPHRFTIALVAFTGSGHAFRGSSWYATQLTELQRKNIRAMIDLDNLGRTPPVFSLAQQDRTLAMWLEVAAHSLQFPTPTQIDPSMSNLPLRNGLLAVKNEDLWADAGPFQHERVPAISLQSARPDMVANLKQAGAVPNAYSGESFNIEAYEDTYRLLCVYVLYLDRNLGRPLIEPGIYSGKIIDTAGVFTTSPVEMSVRIDRFTTTGELNRYELILQKSGQDALADALANEPDKGYLRFGLALPCSVKLVVLQQSGKTPYVYLVGTRVDSRANTVTLGGRGRSTSLGTAQSRFRFTVVKLNLDSKGNGDGLYYNSAKLRFSKKHELEVEDFGSKPDDVMQVKLEQPTLPKTSTATAVASVAPKAVTPAAGSGSTPAVASNAGEGAPVTRPNTAESVATLAPGSASSVPTFKAKARLVQVDVRVIDSQGHPIKGLKKSDFTVLEDGKPQDVNVFEEHSSTEAPVRAENAASATPALPPNTYTNRQSLPVEDTLNILLLDLWNTPLNDQAYARKETIAFLKALPPGKRIALFVLSGRLMLVQDFTNDSAKLVAAAEKTFTDRSLLLTTETERQQQVGLNAEIARAAQPTISAPEAPAGTLNNLQHGGGTMDIGNSQARDRTQRQMDSSRTAQRVTFTLDAFSALSRSVSGYPGRKNLIWLSGSFPVRLRPEGLNFKASGSSASDEIAGINATPDFRAAVRAATSDLATARIAVYPLDVRGLLTSGVDISVGAAASSAFADSGTPDAFSQNLNTQSEGRFGDRSSMKEVALETGGEVLAGNDLRNAIARGIDDGAYYYTLAYTPQNNDSTPTFRRIDVKVSGPSLKLAYRPGYYPNGNPASSQEAPKTHPLIAAMQPGSPASTVVPITAEVLPPDSTSEKVRVNYTIDIAGIDFDQTPDHRRRAVLDYLAVAFSKDGKPVAQASNTVEAIMPESDYVSTLKSGLKLHQELALAPGDYVLRLGVMDHGAQKIGTMEVPLLIGKSQKR
jgi:VWFA-related protein